MRPIVYPILTVLVAALGLTAIDSRLVGRPLSRWMASGLPGDIGRDDISFQGFDTVTQNGARVLRALYRIDDNDIVHPVLPLGVRGCEGATDCAGDLQKNIARDEARTAVARAVLTRFATCGLPPEALRSVGGYPADLTPSNLGDLPRTGEAWRLTAEVTLDTAVLADGRTAFMERLEDCAAGLLTTDLGLWTLPERAWIEAHVVPLDRDIVVSGTPLMSAWQEFVRDQANNAMRLDPRSVLRVLVEAGETQFWPMTGAFSLTRDADEAAVREAIRDWMRHTEWADRADRLADFVSSGIYARAVGDDPAEWRMLVRVTTDDSDPADLAITYNTQTRAVRDIVMLYPFGDDRTREGADWPGDGSLYLP